MSTVVEPTLLADAAAVEPLGDGRYAVDLSAAYTVLEALNGGYLQCVLANAAVAAASEAGAPHILATAVSTNFISTPTTTSSVVTTTVRRVGRGASFVHVALSQNEVVTTESLVTVGTLDVTSTLRYQSSAAPQLAPLEECAVLVPHDRMAMHQSLELRGDPASGEWWRGARGTGEITAWMRLADGGAPWNAWSVLFATDALVPATLPLGSTGWVPTLQLTSYVRRVPASDWLRARQWCVVVADGLVDERCELFDDTGEMVAGSSQLAMVRFSHATP